MIQLELFPEPIEQRQQKEIAQLYDKLERMRKGQYAKITGLEKQIKELISDLEFLKSKICKDGLFL